MKTILASVAAAALLVSPIAASADQDVRLTDKSTQNFGGFDMNNPAVATASVLVGGIAVIAIVSDDDDDDGSSTTTTSTTN
ncbi:hypothetical protein [uncultured Jannaschia sp.]|uniref:hypothetical protein n=1 Tax=uncultured Jannaschia sp. TaxID=293347 RepID=UPI0026118592|nr:hypothetical protein [uncultured Jannaschia sp.]